MAKPPLVSEEMKAQIRTRMNAKKLNPRSLSLAAGGSMTLVRDLLEGRVKNPRYATLQGIARVLDCTVEDLMGSGGPAAAPLAVGQSTAVANRAALPNGAIYTAPDLPILGTARGGLTGPGAIFTNDGIAVTRTYRPVYLLGVANAYAINIVGDSMDPALRHGYLAYVDPSKAPRPGDDIVIVQKSGEWFVKQLVRRTDKKLVAKQHNPVQTIEYPSDAVEHVHLIVGSTRVEV